MKGNTALRHALLAASSNRLLHTFVASSVLTRPVVNRFVAGSRHEDAVRVVGELAAAGLHTSLDYLGEEVSDAARATATTTAYLRLLRALVEAGLTGVAEVSLKLTALGQRIDSELAFEGALQIAAAAAAAGTTVTLDMEDSATTQTTLDTLERLRARFPSVGGVVQAYLRRSEDDCRRLAAAGSRVRLCKGAYAEPPTVAFVSPGQINASYARCLEVLMAGPGYPMVATHDPRLLELALALAKRYGRGPKDFEFQLLYGVRPDEQHRLASLGHLVRVYVPYGDDWYGYLMRRLAERPANLTFFLRSLTGGWRTSKVRR
ncbi:MAG: proline dehydrogenase family protein [Mycobacteriales bacterium]